MTHDLFKPVWVRWVRNPTYARAKGRRTRVMQAPNGQFYRLPERVLYDPDLGERVWQEIQSGQWEHVALTCLDFADDPNARWAYTPLVDRMAKAVERSEHHPWH